MTMDSPQPTTGYEFLFVVEINNDLYYYNQPPLIDLLKLLPTTIRVCAIIHGAMNTLKVYCITKSQIDYVSVATLLDAKTEIIDTNKFSGNSSSLN